ncbi:hypothetical protein ACFX19_040926 [Malus domestica]
MADGGEIFVVSGAGRGHLQPCAELCNHLISRNYHTTLVIPSSSSSSFTQNPLAKILQLTASPGPPNPGPDPLRYQATQDLHDHLASLSDIPDAPLPLCAIVDFQMGWTKEVFWRFQVPVIGFFTFGASAASMEWGAWKVGVGDIRPDELRPIPGLPDHMALSVADLKRRPAGPPRGVPNRPPGGGGGGKGRSGGGGPPKPGDRPPWVPEIEGSMALMFNTCDFIDRAFIDYMKDQMGMPVWGVGPLLPETYWNRNPNPNPNRPVEENQRQSNYTEDDVVQWLDSKPRGSVLYVAFGSEVGPNAEEYPQLASALEESTRPFIWVIQTGVGGGYNPDGLESRVGERGLIICGWAPQLLILSHQSTGGFLSHCGWNSTVEAVCRGVPILGWPIRGDQYCNAKLVQKHLKVGYGVCESFEELVKKEDILKGIERLMGDEDMKRRALETGRKFEGGFPASSAAALDDFVDFIRPKTSSQV